MWPFLENTFEKCSNFVIVEDFYATSFLETVLDQPQSTCAKNPPALCIFVITHAKLIKKLEKHNAVYNKQNVVFLFFQ